MPDHAAPQHMYKLYGLRVASEMALQGIPVCAFAEAADVTLRFQDGDGTLPRLPPDAVPVPLPANRTRKPINIYRLRGEMVFDYTLPALGQLRCCIRAGNQQVLVTIPKEIDAQDLSSFVVGTLLGSVLRQRGIACLHGSAVQVNGRAVLLIGHRGAGKSTTAAALTAFQDARLLADDIAALTWIDGTPHVHPGYPSLRLNRDVLAQIDAGGKATAAPVFSKKAEKRYLRLDPALHTTNTAPCPIGAMYVLRTPDKTTTGPLPTEDALLTLIQNGYAMHAVTSPELVAHEVATLARLLKSVPLFALQKHQGLDRLAETAKTICNNLRAA